MCVYINDTLFTGHDDQEHLEHLGEVLKRTKEVGTRLKSKKCEHLRLLDHTISIEGLRTSNAKVQFILKAPTLKNMAELQSFLGLGNYYGKFLPNLATILSLLYRIAGNF